MDWERLRGDSEGGRLERGGELGFGTLEDASSRRTVETVLEGERLTMT